MRILVVGGGRVGAYLAMRLAGEGHTVTVIEQNPEHARQVVEAAKVLVFEGDGTDIALLRAADVHRADWAVAVTGRDENNLVAAQLCKTLGARRVLARMNDPTNRATFEALDIQTIAVTDLMVKVISREVAVPDLQSHELFAGGRVEVIELEIPEGFEDRKVTDLEIPSDSVLVMVTRGERSVFPRGDTVVRPGDHVLAACRVEEVPALKAAFDLAGNGR